MRLLAIDPAPVASGVVILDGDFRPLMHGKLKNAEILRIIDTDKALTHAAIEVVACYGMAVGREIFQTCEWIGRFTEALDRAQDISPIRIERKMEKLNLCGSMKAKDSNIRRALIDRFARFDFQRGTGLKAKPDWFYGFAADQWAAMAVGVTAIDRMRLEAQK